MSMPRPEDWKIGVRQMLKNDPGFRIEMENDIRELFATGNEQDQRVARRMARGLLGLEFETDAELLEQLRQPISA